MWEHIANLTPIVGGPEPTCLLSPRQGWEMTFPISPPDFGGWGGAGRSARRGRALSHRLGGTDGCSAAGRQSRCTDLGRRLGTTTASAQGHLEKHNKGDGEEEEEEGDTFILLGYSSSFPIQRLVQRQRHWHEQRQRWPSPQHLSCLPKGWGHPLVLMAACLESADPRREGEAPDKWVKLEDPQGKEPKRRFSLEGTNITKA